MVPPLQTEAAEAVTVAAPASTPPVWLSAPTLAGPMVLELTVPPMRLVWPVLYEPLRLIVLPEENTTVAAATDEPASSVVTPPKRSVVPADPVKEPVLVPPLSSPSVPPEMVMSTRLELFMGTASEVIPAPAVLRTVPSLTNVVVPPLIRLMLWLPWMSQVPVLAITQACPVVHPKMSPAVQVVVPFVSRRRPFNNPLVTPEMVSAAL